MLPRSHVRSVATPRSGRFGTTTTPGRSRNNANDLVVHVRIANAVCKRVEVGAQQRFRIRQIEDVRGHANPALVGFIDHGRVELGRELLVHAVTVVDPDLEDVDRERGLFADGVARLRRPSSPNTECRCGPVPAP